jgi:RNA polymerase sigma-70 factor (ECF subfamily)
LVPQLTTDDSALIAAAQQGRLDAFNQLVERYQAAVYNVCLRMVGPASAEDAAQETFFGAYRAIKSYRGGVFRGWLLRIASNHCLDQLRRGQRHPVTALDDDLPLVDPLPLPEEAAMSAETVQALERAIGQLPPEQRLCVVLVDVQGLDYDEAAEAMGINLGTVKSRLSRARARLRELLGPEFRPERGD